MLRYYPDIIVASLIVKFFNQAKSEDEVFIHLDTVLNYQKFLTISSTASNNQVWSIDDYIDYLESKYKYFSKDTKNALIYNINLNALCDGNLPTKDNIKKYVLSRLIDHSYSDRIFQSMGIYYNGS